MCGIFGIISTLPVDKNEIEILAKSASRRGRDASGLFYSGITRDVYQLYRASGSISTLLEAKKEAYGNFIMGHSRLTTNGANDNQPIYRDDICVIHNGIIVNFEILWDNLNRTPKQDIDSEVIAAFIAEAIDAGYGVEGSINNFLEVCTGVVACAIAIPNIGKLCLFSNNGSLYLGKNRHTSYFSSEKHPLTFLPCDEIIQVKNNVVILDIPISTSQPQVHDLTVYESNILHGLGSSTEEERQLEYKKFHLVRCSRCILPETMPYIRFDETGVCNYCNNYIPKNNPRPISELLNLVEPYRGISAVDCIVPFSGGRDSTYSLHLTVKELGLKPVTFTYDWGMVTDLARRNISRVCGELGIENIVVADDIRLKRSYIAQNFLAWLNSPHLGMVNILTAGDKHFFRYIERIKRETGVSLNLWGINPLETTYFKAGFLGIAPDFEMPEVYLSGINKQLKYQFLRMTQMIKSPKYFNASLLDNLIGEYYRSVHKKKDYFHTFDFFRWDENIVDQTIINNYGWETALDTKSTWRIGDGTAAMYNYIYYTIAGFTEHDTFRSNQIREGDLTREKALILVEDENRPRYPNIKWYLDAIGLDFTKVIQRINLIPKYSKSY